MKSLMAAESRQRWRGDFGRGWEAGPGWKRWENHRILTVLLYMVRHGSQKNIPQMDVSIYNIAAPLGSVMGYELYVKTCPYTMYPFNIFQRDLIRRLTITSQKVLAANNVAAFFCSTHCVLVVHVMPPLPLWLLPITSTLDQYTHG